MACMTCRCLVAPCPPSLLPWGSTMNPTCSQYASHYPGCITPLFPADTGMLLRLYCVLSHVDLMQPHSNLTQFVCCHNWPHSHGHLPQVRVMHTTAVAWAAAPMAMAAVVITAPASAACCS